MAAFSAAFLAAFSAAFLAAFSAAFLAAFSAGRSAISKTRAEVSIVALAFCTSVALGANPSLARETATPPPASDQASNEASEQASNETSEQASNETSEQASKQASNKSSDHERSEQRSVHGADSASNQASKNHTNSKQGDGEAAATTRAGESEATAKPTTEERPAHGEIELEATRKVPEKNADGSDANSTSAFPGAKPSDIKSDAEGDYILVPDPLPAPLALAPNMSVEERAAALHGAVARIFSDRGENTVVEAMGFFIAHDRLIVPHHLLEQSRRVAFQMQGASERTDIAGILAADLKHDLGVVKLTHPVAAPALVPRESAAVLGEQVFVVGAAAGAHAVLVPATLAQVTGLLRLSISLPPSFAGAAVVDPSGSLVGVVRRTAAEESGLALLVPAQDVKALALTPAALQPVTTWAKAARTASGTSAIDAQQVAAGGVFVSTGSCLSACGAFACGLPVVGGVGLFAIIGCLAGAAIVLSGGSLLAQLVQILSMPMGMSAIVTGAAGSVAGAALLLGLASAAASAAVPVATSGFALVVLGARNAVMPEEPWRPSVEPMTALRY